MANGSLYEVFLSVRDRRQSSGRRHPLAAILSQATVAIMAGARSLEALAQFGRDRGAAFGAAVGYTDLRLPCKATFHNVFKALPAGAFESAIESWLVGRAKAGWKAVAVDGKALCGATGEKLPGVHLLTAYAPEAQTALAQMRVNAKTNEHKAALQLLDLLPVEGKLVTGDAMFCQRDLSQKVRQKKGITSGRSRTINPSSSRKS
jgi:hypothetical protein